MYRVPELDEVINRKNQLTTVTFGTSWLSFEICLEAIGCPGRGRTQTGPLAYIINIAHTIVKITPKG